MSRRQPVEQSRARAAVTYAISTGRLTRLPCEVCGNPKTDAHHPNGYGPDHVLDVVWLCRRDHVAEHRPFMVWTRERSRERKRTYARAYYSTHRAERHAYYLANRERQERLRLALRAARRRAVAPEVGVPGARPPVSPTSRPSGHPAPAGAATRAPEHEGT